MIIAGLMTGTSADGLDVALVELRHAGHKEGRRDAGEVTMRLLTYREMAFDSELSNDIQRLLEPADVPLSLVSSVDARIGRFCGEAVVAVCQEAGTDCDLVVSHGQTVRHDIEGEAVTSTLQIGQPAWIAERTETPVLSDVRVRDVSAGGQGAPLAGLLDHMLLAGAEAPTAMLNLGGIANITVVAPHRDTVAFDTGPANALIDAMARSVTAAAGGIDRDGALAAAGRTNAALLEDLLADPYYKRRPPKSTGKELFHKAYLDRFLELHPEVGEKDVLATLTTLTARTVADACRDQQVSSVVASGGGTRNPSLMTALRTELGDQVPVCTTDEAFGLPEGSKEACLMALLGWFSWYGLPATLPSVTGASHASLAGAFTPGDSPLRLPEPLEAAPARLRLLSNAPTFKQGAPPTHPYAKNRTAR